MPTNTVMPIRDLEDAERAYQRVRAEAEALKEADLAVANVDVITACSIVIGVAPGLQPFRARMAALAEFEIRCLDRLEDYAKATWFSHVSNLPPPESTAGADLEEEVRKLRTKLLTWCVPLTTDGYFSQAAVDKIKEGSGRKDMASDLVSLSTLFQSRWDELQTKCNVSVDELKRAAEIGPAMFALVSRRENEATVSVSDATLRTRRCWTLLDHAYSQCRRAVSYLRWADGDVDNFVPSLRRNSGVSRTAAPVQAPAAAPATVVAPAAPANTPGLGGGSSPFVKPT